MQSVRSIQSTTATTATQLDGMQRTVIVAEGLGTNVQLDRWHSLHLKAPVGRAWTGAVHRAARAHDERSATCQCCPRVAEA